MAGLFGAHGLLGVPFCWAVARRGVGGWAGGAMVRARRSPWFRRAVDGGDSAAEALSIKTRAWWR